MNEKKIGAVTIRVWLETHAKIGHTSLQTQHFPGNNLTSGIGNEGVYVSIYPTGHGVKPTDRIGVPFKTKTLLEDENKYINDKKPIVVTLYSLNVEAIKNEYKKLVDNGFNFSLLGSVAFKNPETHNCCSLVAHLLKVGGIDKLAENNKILNFPLGMVVSSVSTFLSWSVCSYFSSSKMVLSGIMSLLFGALLSLRTADVTSNSLISIMAPSVSMSIAMLVGGSLGGLGGVGVAYLETFARADNKHLNLTNLIEYGSKFFNIKGSTFLTAITGGLILAMSLVIAIAGSMSARLTRYGTSTWFAMKDIKPWLPSKLPMFLYLIMYPATGLLVGCRIFHLAGERFDHSLDSLIDYYFIYQLIKTQYVQFSLAATLPQFLNKILSENKETAPLIAQSIKILGEQSYEKKLKLCMLVGASLFGLTSCISSSIGFYTMNRMAIRFKKLLDQTILTPTAVAEIATSAKKVEDFNKEIKPGKCLSHLLNKSKPPLMVNRRKETIPRAPSTFYHSPLSTAEVINPAATSHIASTTSAETVKKDESVQKNKPF